MTATEVIAGVDTKAGTSQKTGKPWKKYTIHTRSGANYNTFDAGIGELAMGSVGKTANIDYEQSDFGRDLKGFVLDESAPVQHEPVVRDVKGNGEVDWDLVGLRKTRCALWVAVLKNAGLKDMSAAAVGAFGRELVVAAETDIYHRQPAGGLEDIPF